MPQGGQGPAGKVPGEQSKSRAMERPGSASSLLAPSLPLVRVAALGWPGLLVGRLRVLTGPCDDAVLVGRRTFH